MAGYDQESPNYNGTVTDYGNPATDGEANSFTPLQIGDGYTQVPIKLHTPFNSPDDGGMDVTGHAKELCVNKLGHTLVKPPEGGTSRGKFKELFSKHRIETLTYCSVFWSFGMGVAFLGPTLLDLECRISSVFSSMSWVFFSQSLFTLVGSAFGGALVQNDSFKSMFESSIRNRHSLTLAELKVVSEKLGSHIVLFISVLMMGVTLTIVPACKKLITLTATLGLMGFFMGTIDTVANISMLQLYGRNVAPFMQSLHFCYGLGAFLSPIVTKPFLLNEDCNNLVLNSTDTERMISLKLDNFTIEATRELKEAQTNSRVQYAFYIMASMQLPVVILLAFLVYRDKYGSKPSYESQLEAHSQMQMNNSNGALADPTGLTGAKCIKPDGRDTADSPHASKTQVHLVIMCAATMLFIYDGMQTSYGGYIYTYAVRSIDSMAQNEAAYLNADFWGTFALGRLFSIAISTRITPQWMLLGNILGCMLAMTLMISSPNGHYMVYLGTGLFGTFMSSVFPTTVSMTETYIHVTSQITSVLVMTAAMGEMILPVIIGHEFDSTGPKVLLVSGLTLTLISLVVYFVFLYIAGNIARLSSERSVVERLKAIFRREVPVDEGIGLMPQNVKYYTRLRSSYSDVSVNQKPDTESNYPVSQM